MTGPEHYRKAEQQLQFALEASTDSTAETHCAIAQVHATLALAAATALSAPVEDDLAGFTTEEWDAWHTAAGTRPGGGR
ncbi:hypothetical protein ACFWIB_15485 [Streptomyces sp. NPDC127051]|uniref:hypothetical protein n=1 Tax=Streptomyces sp. NPDC127051 TaxID=3347119 RepID=UPI00365B30E3